VAPTELRAIFFEVPAGKIVLFLLREDPEFRAHILMRPFFSFRSFSSDCVCWPCGRFFRRAAATGRFFCRCGKGHVAGPLRSGYGRKQGLATECAGLVPASRSNASNVLVTHNELFDSAVQTVPRLRYTRARSAALTNPQRASWGGFSGGHRASGGEGPRPGDVDTFNLGNIGDNAAQKPSDVPASLGAPPFPNIKIHRFREGRPGSPRAGRGRSHRAGHDLPPGYPTGRTTPSPS